MDESRDSRDTKYTSLNYNMGMINSETVSEMYNRPSTSQIHSNNDLNDIVQSHSDTTRTIVSESNMIQQGGVSNSVNIQRGLKRSSNNVCFVDNTVENRQVIVPHSQTINVSHNCLSDNSDNCFSNLCAPKKSPPSNGKKTKGRVKIKMEYIDNKLRRYTTFSKRKTGIMKKAYELSTLTGTQVMLLVASETGHVYTFATRKLQPMITSEAGKALIQTCLNSPDPPLSSLTGDQRMSATGFEETELTYNITDDDQKVRQLVYGSPQGSGLHVGYSNTASVQSSVHASSSLPHHTHLLTHTHTSQNSHLVPSSSPNSVLTVSPYIQSCPSPLTSHITFNPHATHSHNQR